ncbi:MAG: TonB family protein [Desulforhopalus sp.]|nr:TonB family protein [Desulforhopalus sp.]
MPWRLLSALLLAMACHALIFQISLPERRPPLIGGAQTITLQLKAAPLPTVTDDQADNSSPAEPPPPPREELLPAEPPDVVPQAAPPPEPPAPTPPEAEPAPEHLRADAQVKRLLSLPPARPVPSPRPAPRPIPQPARPDPQPVAVEQLPAAQPAAAKEMIPAENASAPTIIQARPAYRTNPKPVYPELARRRNWQGTVTLSVTVESDGRPGQVDIATSSGYPLLDTAANRAVRSWRFHPGSENGRPVTMTVLVPIDFRLE